MRAASAFTGTSRQQIGDGERGSGQWQMWTWQQRRGSKRIECEVLVAFGATSLFALFDHDPHDVMIIGGFTTSASDNAVVKSRLDLDRVVFGAEGTTQDLIVTKEIRILDFSTFQTGCLLENGWDLIVRACLGRSEWRRGGRLNGQCARGDGR